MHLLTKTTSTTKLYLQFRVMMGLQEGENEDDLIVRMLPREQILIPASGLATPKPPF